MLRNGLSRVCASFNALIIFGILAPIFVQASLQPPEQLHFICKSPGSNWCVKWNLTKYFANQLNVPNDFKTSKEVHRLCGISQLAPISPHKKFIKVNLLNPERASFIFCQTSTIKNGGDYNSLAVLKAMAILRVRRETSFTPRGRYRGQTQSQYLAIDNGNGKNDGKAEAHSAADSSRASVSGNSGMGQAQSQSIYDPSCDECNEKSKEEAQFLQRTPEHGISNPQEYFPGFNKDSSGVPINNRYPSNSKNVNFLPTQHGYDNINHNPDGVNWNHPSSIPGNQAYGAYPENERRYFNSPTQGTGRLGGGDRGQPNQDNANDRLGLNNGMNPDQDHSSKVSPNQSYGSKVNPDQGYGPNVGTSNEYGLTPTSNQRPLGNNNGYPGFNPNYNNGVRSPDLSNIINSQTGFPQQARPNQSGHLSPDDPNLKNTMGQGSFPNQGYGSHQGEINNKDQVPFFNQKFDLPNGSTGYRNWPFISGNFPDGSYYCCVVTPNKSQITGPTETNKNGISTGSSNNGLQTDNGYNYQIPYQGPNYFQGTGHGPGYSGTTNTLLGETYNAPNNLLSPGTSIRGTGTYPYSNQYPTSTGLVSGSPRQWNTQNETPETSRNLNQYGVENKVPYYSNGISPVKPVQMGIPGIQVQGPGGQYEGPDYQNGLRPEERVGMHGMQSELYRPSDQIGGTQNSLLQNRPSQFDQSSVVGGAQQVGVPYNQGGTQGLAGASTGSIGRNQGPSAGTNTQGSRGQIGEPGIQGAYQGPGIQGPIGTSIQNELQVSRGQMSGPGNQREVQGSGIHLPGGHIGMPGMQNGIQSPGFHIGGTGVPMEFFRPGAQMGQGGNQGIGVPGSQDESQSGGQNFQGGLEPQGGAKIPGGQVSGPSWQGGLEGQIGRPGLPGVVQNSGNYGGLIGQGTMQDLGGAKIPGGQVSGPSWQGGLEGQIGRPHVPGIEQNLGNYGGPIGQGTMQGPGGQVGGTVIQGGPQTPVEQPGRSANPGNYQGPGGRSPYIPENQYGAPGIPGTQNNVAAYPNTNPSGIQGPDVLGQRVTGNQINYGHPEKTGLKGALPNKNRFNQPGLLPITGSNYPTQVGYGTQSVTGGNEAPMNVVDPNSVTNVIEEDDSEAQASVSQADNGTIASASSKGGNDKGRAQTNVQGTYTGSGSFSAQAQISDTNKAAESEVSGGKEGASSKAQGSGKKNKSQASVQLGSETGSIQTQSQSDGKMHSSNSQVQGSVKGGMADSQARGPGITSSQAQIGFTPYKAGDKSHEEFKTPFLGSGTAAAQSSGRTGQSQSQLHGTFKYGITYNGAAQAGASIDKDAVLPNRVTFEKIDVFDKNAKNVNIELALPAETSTPSKSHSNENLPQEKNNIPTDLNSEYNSHPHYDHHKTEAKLPSTDSLTPESSKRSFHTTYGPNNSDYEDKTDKEDNPEDYDPETGLGAEFEHEYPNFYEEESQALQNSNIKEFEVKQNTGGNNQHIVLNSLKDQDAFITQRSSLQPDERKVYQPGEKVPGTGGYTIPLGFTGSVKSVASRDNTYVVGSKDSPSQAQTVSLKPGTGNIKYVYPPARAKTVPSKDLKSLQSVKNDDNRYVSVSKSVTRDLDSKNNIQKQYSHTYYTKSSSCGYFTFTCTMVSGVDGKKKVCKPKIPTNPDGTPMRC